VDDVVVFKTAHHVDGGVGLADVLQKLVAQTFTGAGTCDQTGDVDKLDNRGDDALWRDDRSELLEARVWHFDDADVGLNRAKRVVFGSNAGLGQGVKQGRFTDVGQAHNSAFHARKFLK
jgi:hypothetical protein